MSPTSSGQERGGFLLISINQYLQQWGSGKFCLCSTLLPDCTQKTLISDLSKDSNPRNSTQPFYRVQNNPFRKQQTRLSVDRPVDRPYVPVDRSQPRVGSLQSVDRSVDRSLPAVDRAGRPPRYACQRAHRSTGPVDRAIASAYGRPGRSTVHLLFCCFCCC